jgi:hAT family C-terminal dimerisation region
MKDDQIDILKYWKMNAIAYPTWAIMARDVFVVPVSTVPSESYFSSANRILIDKRTKLVQNFLSNLCAIKIGLMLKVECNMIPHLRQQHLS